jgi:hypothetical protein
VNFLPSKKIVSVFILTVAFVVAIIIAFGRDKSSAVINVASNLVAGDKISIPENPNWQKDLNVLPQNEIPIENGTTTENNVTDTVSQSLISNYMALKQNGKLDSASAQKLVDQSISYIEQSGAQTNKMTLDIVPENTQSITDYGENLGNIAKIRSQEEIKNDAQLFVQMFKSPDSAKLKEFNAVISVYENILNRLIKMPVPKIFSKAHTDLINGTSGIISSFKAVKNISNDPLGGIVALQLYQKNTSSFALATKAIISFIKQKNLVYKQGSGGYYLLYEIQ